MQLSDFIKKFEELKTKGFILSTKNMIKIMLKEICNECGKSVKLGTGLFVNRVIDFNEPEDRVLIQKPFPEGDFICPLCEENEQAYQKKYVGN